MNQAKLIDSLAVANTRAFCLKTRLEAALKHGHANYPELATKALEDAVATLASIEARTAFE